MITTPQKLPAVALPHRVNHEPGGSDALTVDAAAVTGSLRTVGTGALQACAGNDARLSDARTPTTHAPSHAFGSTDAITITEGQVTNLAADLSALAALALTMASLRI